MQDMFIATELYMTCRKPKAADETLELAQKIRANMRFRGSVLEHLRRRHRKYSGETEIPLKGSGSDQ